MLLVGLRASHCECQFTFPLPCQVIRYNNFFLTIIIALCSVSSDGSAESHLVEQEDIIALTQVTQCCFICLVLSY